MPLEGGALKNAEGHHRAFLERLAAYRVLDPACGSGNFLYLALLAIKDIEHRVNLEGEALGLPRGFPRIGPECVLGIEINPFAAELAPPSWRASRFGSGKSSGCAATVSRPRPIRS